MNSIQRMYFKPPRGGRPPHVPASAKSDPPVRVWLVDDDRELRRLLAELLERIGGIRRPREFFSPETLLAALAVEVPPDVILLDIHLGEKNGIDYLESIRILAPKTRVFILTTFHDSMMACRALKAGACGFLLKRTPIEEILAQILMVYSQPNRSWAETVQN